MRILLVRTFYSLEKYYFPRYIDEPLALEYLAAYIKDQHQVKIFDALLEGWNQYREVVDDPDRLYQGADLEQLAKTINEFKPEVIGINWFFSSQNDAVDITTQYLKDKFPNIPITVGGPQPSSEPAQTLKDYPAVDIVVYGEGEITLLELLNKKLKDLPSILGIVYRDNNQIIQNERRPLIKNLDDLSFPARNLLKFKNYGRQRVYSSIYKKLKKLGLKDERLNRNLSAKVSSLPMIDKIYYWGHNRKSINKNLVPAADIVTSRGCPNNCIFCAVHNIWGRGWRPRSAENVLAEIKELVEKYDIRHFNFQDDNFNVLKERTIKICQGLIEIKKKYNISFSVPPGLYLPSLDEEVLTWLKKAGMNLVRISVESGNQEVLNNIIRKRIDLNQVKKVTTLCRQLGIRTEGAFIFGLPGETIQTMKDTAEFAKNAGFDRIKKFIYQPFPNTDMYKICIENGYLTPDFNPKKIFVTGDKCYIKTNEFNPEDVIRIARE